MTLKTYKIRSGQFRMDDGSLREVGQTIELEDDVAALHAPALQLVTDDAAAPAPGPAFDEA